MGKAIAITCLVAAALILPVMAGAKMDFRACKFRIMRDARYLTGKSRKICGAQCAAAINRCMANGG
jgi:hypothetical protein